MPRHASLGAQPHQVYLLCPQLCQINTKIDLVKYENLDLELQVDVQSAIYNMNMVSRQRLTDSSSIPRWATISADETKLELDLMTATCTYLGNSLFACDEEGGFG